MSGTPICWARNGTDVVLPSFRREPRLPCVVRAITEEGIEVEARSKRVQPVLRRSARLLGIGAYSLLSFYS